MQLFQITLGLPSGRIRDHSVPSLRWKEQGAVTPSKSLCPSILGDSKFVELLKTVHTFNLKPKDESLNKFFFNKLSCSW